MSSLGAGATHAKAHDEPDSPYTFQQLIENVPLLAEETEEKPHITAVDYWDGNLYIGGSHGQLLHFVSIPGDDESAQPSYILASRLEPEYIAAGDATDLPGIQQILLLPSVRRACVRCNNTLTFYTLPELSPAYGGKIKQGDCNWVGGLDENLNYEEDEEVVIILCLKQRLRLIRVGEQARKVRDIEIPGCLRVRRRGNRACVADDTSYSLIDVVNQQKIELFPVASEPPPATPPPQPRQRTPSPRPRIPPGVRHERPRPVSMHFPDNAPGAEVHRRGHERISSMGAIPRNMDRLTPESPVNWPSRRSSRTYSPAPASLGSPSRDRSPLGETSGEAAPERMSDVVVDEEPPLQKAEPLAPHIVSPTPEEFLLATGTVACEPGVGMFVNQEGDVSRAPLDISFYPSHVILETGGDHDGSNADTSSSTSEDTSLLALVQREAFGDSLIEIQSLAQNEAVTKSYLQIPQPVNVTSVPGLCQATSNVTISTPGVVHSLGLRRLYLTKGSESSMDEGRMEQEDGLIERFATTTSRSVLYRGSTIWWVVRHPILLKLDARLELALRSTAQTNLLVVNRSEVQYVYNSLRGREADDEIHFMTYNYIRQKAVVLMLLDLLVQTVQRTTAAQKDLQYTLEALITSEIEPRVVLSLIPALKGEVVEGKDGIWVPGGLKTLLERIRHNEQLQSLSHDTDAVYWNNILPLIKGYLTAWRKKKGFGSIADEAHVFQTVDAALLHVLLILDQRSPSGPASAGSLRAELNEVVDKGVDGFDRAVLLLESFHRLYVLSRLYQHKKMTPQVLSTWRRILEGEDDRGGELVDGETDIRKYLTRIKDVDVIKEYGTWLANRNPSLGVQIFADDASRVKFSTAEAVELLKNHAPKAVKYYLEYLVFTKQKPQYATDLINFYLDGLLESIETSEAVRDAIATANSVYRALPAPKPTFMQFLHDNAPDAEWHRNRLRLIQLLDNGSGAVDPVVSSSTAPSASSSVSKLDHPALAARLAPHAALLVPETIILASMRNEPATVLGLLVSALGDADTAVRYCLSRSPSPAGPLFSPAAASSSSSSSSSSSAIAGPRSSSSSSLSSALDHPRILARQRARFASLLDAYLALQGSSDDGDDDGAERGGGGGVGRRGEELATQLLARFGAWFDVAHVLGRVPDTWTLRGPMESFLLKGLAGLVGERRAGGVQRALAAGENLRVAVEVVERMEELGPVMEGGPVDGQSGGGGAGGKSWADSGYGSAGAVGGGGSVESGLGEA